MKLIEKRIKKLEEVTGITGHPSPIMFYNGEDPAEPEKCIRQFREAHPDFKGTVFLLPDIES